MSIAEWTLNINVNSDAERARVLSWTVEEGLLGVWSMADVAGGPEGKDLFFLFFFFVCVFFLYDQNIILPYA